MEHSTSAVNWQPRNVAKRPGEMARNSLSHFGRGADGILFFQWRASRSGAEKFHSAMLPHAGTSSRVWNEVVDLGAKLGRLAEVRGSRVRADVAILWDFESFWAQDLEWRPSEDVSHDERIRAYYEKLWRDGITGYRFILIGIGVSQFFLAGSGYVLSRANQYNAREAMTWLVGAVGQAGDTELRVLFLSLAVVLPAVFLMTRQLAALELGDDTAKALGVRVETMRLALMLTAVVLIALATAVAGPMAFVALIAGPIASRLVGAGSSALLAAAFVGASIVLAADLVAQHALPAQLPTGVVTGAIGAPYLIWLLVSVNREGRGG
ncbi:MAG: hypothetical protein EON52_21525, partial [Actinomycetales bacterium]